MALTISANFGAHDQFTGESFVFIHSTAIYASGLHHYFLSLIRKSSQMILADLQRKTYHWLA
jgi:hypothetical protein